MFLPVPLRIVALVCILPLGLTGCPDPGDPEPGSDSSSSGYSESESEDLGASETSSPAPTSSCEDCNSSTGENSPTSAAEETGGVGGGGDGEGGGTSSGDEGSSGDTDATTGGEVCDVEYEIWSSCDDEVWCLPGFECVGHACVPKCDGEQPCDSKGCGDTKCNVRGQCVLSCSDTSPCEVPGMTCDEQTGECIYDF